jgi:rhodanese-related sulfurtransferase
MSAIKTISASEFGAQHAKQSLHIIDVRTPAEFSTLHVQGAINAPLNEWQTNDLIEELKQRGFQHGDTLYLLCQAGTRAKLAAEKIANDSDLNVIVVEGGTNACINNNIRTNTLGGSTLSLERQVRIAAGSLVLIGTIIGLVINPLGFGLAGFVGAGLIFAGITDTCAMGMLLARMPWNQHA